MTHERTPRTAGDTGAFELPSDSFVSSAHIPRGGGRVCGEAQVATTGPARPLVQGDIHRMELRRSERAERGHPAAQVVAERLQEVLVCASGLLRGLVHLSFDRNHLLSNGL